MFFSFGNEMVVYINSDISIAKEKEIQTITTCISHFASIRSKANKMSPKCLYILQTNAVVQVGL